MVKTKEEIIENIKTYIEKCGRSYSDWYVGIAKDPEKRLFSDHNVGKENDLWIYREANNSEDAREIEKIFVHNLGTKGDTGGGDDDARFVYAYKITHHTKE